MNRWNTKEGEGVGTFTSDYTPQRGKALQKLLLVLLSCCSFFSFPLESWHRLSLSVSLAAALINFPIPGACGKTSGHLTSARHAWLCSFFFPPFPFSSTALFAFTPLLPSITAFNLCVLRLCWRRQRAEAAKEGRGDKGEGPRISPSQRHLRPPITIPTPFTLFLSVFVVLLAPKKMLCKTGDDAHYTYLFFLLLQERRRSDKQLWITAFFSFFFYSCLFYLSNTETTALFIFFFFSWSYAVIPFPRELFPSEIYLYI